MKLAKSLLLIVSAWLVIAGTAHAVVIDLDDHNDSTGIIDLSVAIIDGTGDDLQILGGSGTSTIDETAAVWAFDGSSWTNIGSDFVDEFVVSTIPFISSATGVWDDAAFGGSGTGHIDGWVVQGGSNEGFIDLNDFGLSQITKIAVVGHDAAGLLYQFSDINAINTAAVPVPAALWLFGSGLLGLVAVGRQKHA